VCNDDINERGKLEEKNLQPAESGSRVGCLTHRIVSTAEVHAAQDIVRCLVEEKTFA